jgi:hypothetical protein
MRPWPSDLYVASLLLQIAEVSLYANVTLTTGNYHCRKTAESFFYTMVQSPLLASYVRILRWMLIRGYSDGGFLRSMAALLWDCGVELGGGHLFDVLERNYLKGSLCIGNSVIVIWYG